MLPRVCSIIDHMRRQNVVRISVTHSAIASCATFLFLPHFDVIYDLLATLSTHVFETRTATGSELFSLLTRVPATTFPLLSVFSRLEMIGIKIWETPLSWHTKCPLPVAVRVSKTRVLKLSITEQTQHGS